MWLLLSLNATIGKLLTLVREIQLWVLVLLLHKRIRKSVVVVVASKCTIVALRKFTSGVRNLLTGLAY